MSFTLEQVLTMAGLAASILAGLWAVVRALSRKMDLNAADADLKRSQAAQESTRQHETLRNEMARQITELQRDLHAGLARVHERINRLAETHARRDDLKRVEDEQIRQRTRIEALAGMLTSRVQGQAEMTCQN